MRIRLFFYIALTIGFGVYASPDLLRDGLAKRTVFNVDLINPSDIPSQCQSTCNPVVTAANTCQTYACCTNTIGSEALACIDCIVATDPTTGMVTWGQDLLNGYVEDCDLIGVTLQPLTVSYSGTIATGSATETATLAIPLTTTAAAAPTTTTGSGGVISSNGGGIVSNGSDGGFPSALVGLGIVSAVTFVFILSL